MHVRHEESGGFAAGTESLITGKLTACIGSCGPGALHFINGLYDANKNGASVLCIATQIPSYEIGTKYIQETDPKELFRDCSVFCEYINDTKQIPRIMGLAMQNAISKKGVAVIIIPGDISSESIPSEFNTKYIPHYTNPVRVTPESDIDMIADIINESDSIGILYGGSCDKSMKELKEISEKIKAPIAWNLFGRAISYNSTYNGGCADNFCDTYDEDIVKKSDLIIITGMKDFPDSVANTNAKVIRIGNNIIDNSQKIHADYIIEGNEYEIFSALKDKIKHKTGLGFAEGIARKHKSDKQSFELEASVKSDSKGVIRPEYLFSLLNNIIPDNAIITSDIGTSALLTGIYICPKPGRSFYQSSVYGSIGNSLPMSLGAAAANTGKKVIAICGDGGISMLLGEMITLNQMNLDVKVIILNNSGYEYTGYINKNNPIGEDMPTLTDFSKVAQSFGLESKQVVDADNLEVVLKEWIDSDKANVLEVKTAHLNNPSLFFKQI